MKFLAKMEKALPDYIRENKDLRNVLLEQEGGIIKYLAGHLDADGIEALYKGYREQCVENFRAGNKWRMGEDNMKREALADDHIKKELVYQEALKPVLSEHEELAEQVRCFIKDYMDYAFKESHQRLYSNDTPAYELYGDVIVEFRDKLFGKAHICLWRVLEEYRHRDKAKAEKDADDLWMEFELQKYADAYSIGLMKLRQGVREELDERTHNKNEEERRQICRQMAKDDMKRFWQFAHLVNSDYDLIEFCYAKTEEGIPLTQIWSARDLERLGYDVSKVLKKAKIYISKEEMMWLREGMLYVDSSPDTDKCEEMSPLQKCFQSYYHLLQEIGSIWAVLLREHGIDISELEEETGCVLNKNGFYNDMSMDGRRGKIFVIKHKDDEVKNKRKAIMEYVGMLKDVVDERFLPVYDEMWHTILKLESVKSIIYKYRKNQKGHIFSLRLVGNIINLMKENGVFIINIAAKLAEILEPEKGKDSSVAGYMRFPLEDKGIKKDIEEVIIKFSSNI